MHFYDPVSKVIKPDLNAEVEKWLKDKSNKITEIPFGHSEFKDGIIPYSKAPVQQLDIEKYNAERVIEHSPVKPKKNVKQNKPAKAKTVKNRSAKPIKEKVLKPKPPTKLIVYSLRSMIYMNNCVAFKEARKLKLMRFEALCIRHSYSTFKMMKNGRARCIKCLEEYNENNLKDYKRKKLNRELMRLAALAKQKNFIGKCKIHGETNFLISHSSNTISQLNYKCCRCSSIAQMKARKKKGAAA